MTPLNSLHRITTLALVTLFMAPVAVAQRHVGGMLAAGYGTALGAPESTRGGPSVRASVWYERRPGLEFGLAAGRDGFEDRTVTTRGLFRDPATGSVGILPCTGCVAGAQEDRARSMSWYLTPTVTVRASSHVVQPYGALGLGLYRVRDRNDGRFLPTSGAAPAVRSVTASQSTIGGNLTIGLQVPVLSRIAVDVSSQVHSAARIGNDYAGATSYGVFALGVSLR